MKTIILTSQGQRKPKQQGLATAGGSALHIYDMRRYFLKADPKNKLYIIDAENVNQARELIISCGNMPVAKFDNDQTICIGERAIKAIAGAERSIANWDKNIAVHGSVPIKETKAL